ncbi:MAG TPA: hypothetical protein VEK76_07815 [Candidatus Binatia bacterium]|nr:hypothetical protein [Candidatus Binatia bacterium]
MITVVIMATILGLMVVAFVAFFFYSRTPEWGESEVRKSFLRMLVIISPLWGMRYHEPHHELPTWSAPGPDEPSPPGLRPPDEQGGG